MLYKISWNFFCSLLLTWWDTQDVIEALVRSSLVHTEHMFTFVSGCRIVLLQLDLWMNWWKNQSLFLIAYFSLIILKGVGSCCAWLWILFLFIKWSGRDKKKKVAAEIVGLSSTLPFIVMKTWCSLGLLAIYDKNLSRMVRSKMSLAKVTFPVCLCMYDSVKII